jgi:hypothetical protein
MPEAAEIAIIDEAMIPAGAAAGNGASGNGESRGEVLRMRATAYDLSVESCGKDRSIRSMGSLTAAPGQRQAEQSLWTRR